MSETRLSVSTPGSVCAPMRSAPPPPAPSRPPAPAPPAPQLPAPALVGCRPGAAYRNPSVTEWSARRAR
eukprot:scaffold121566_cov39-Phaeocystis_antarctica.AAC.1